MIFKSKKNVMRILPSKFLQVFRCYKNFLSPHLNQSFITLKAGLVVLNDFVILFELFKWSEVKTKMLFVVPKKLLNTIGKHPEKVQNWSDRIRFLVFVCFLHLNLIPLVNLNEKNQNLSSMIKKISAGR